MYISGCTLLISNKDMNHLDFDPRTKEIASLDNFVIFFGSIAILTLNMAALFYIVIRFVDIYCAGRTLYLWGGGSVLPFLIKFLAPYTMAASAKLLFDVKELDAENEWKIEDLEVSIENGKL